MRPTDKIACLVLILSALVFTRSAQASTYYVSREGKDSNPGTAARPWRSLARVNAAALQPGDRVLFEGGQTFPGNLVLDQRIHTGPRAPITIGSFGRGRALIEAGLGTGILIRNIGGVAIRDLVVVGAGASKNQGFGIMAVNERGRARLDFLHIENVAVSGFRWAGIYVGGPPTLLPGFQDPPGSRYGYRDVVIARSLARNNLYCGILVSGPWNKYWNKRPAGYANEDVTIRDCVVHDNWGDPHQLKGHSGDGILIDDTDGGLIDHCLAYHNGGKNGSRTGGPVGIWADSANRITIQFCRSFANRTGGDTDGGGFDFDGGVSNSVLQYNYSADNDGIGFLVWNYKYADHPLANDVIRYNLSVNDGRKHTCGIKVVRQWNGKREPAELYNCASVEVGTRGDPVRNIAVYNNTVLATRWRGRIPTAVWVGGTRDNRAVSFRNNLFLTDGAGPLVAVTKNQTGVSFQGNAYWADGRPFLVSYAGKLYHTLAAWRADTGQETLRGKPVGMFVNPRLSGMAERGTVARLRLQPRSSLHGFRLLPDSPLLNAALDLRADLGIDVGRRDFWGTPLPRQGPFDIGAFQAPKQENLRRSASRGQGP